MPQKVHNFFRRRSLGKRRESAPSPPKKNAWGPTHSYDSEDSSSFLNELIDGDDRMKPPLRSRSKQRSRKVDDDVPLNPRRPASSPQLMHPTADQPPRYRPSSSYDHSSKLTAMTTPSSRTKTSDSPQEPGSHDTMSTKSSHSSAGSRQHRRTDMLVNDVNANRNQDGNETDTKEDHARTSQQAETDAGAGGAHSNADRGHSNADRGQSDGQGKEELPSAFSGSFVKPHPLQAMWLNAQSAFNFKEDPALATPQKGFRANKNRFIDYMQDVCSPCQPRSLEETFSGEMVPKDDEASHLGIGRMEPPGEEEKKEEEASIVSHRSSSTRKSTRKLNQAISSDTASTPADRRRERHRRQQWKMVPRTKEQSEQELQGVKDDVEVTPTEVICKDVIAPSGASITSLSSKKKKNMPLNTLTVKSEEAKALERSISELTMRSSYGEATAKLAENRRMAYYAVGKHHRNSGRGGNRRCYFTGKLILGGAPFYAGSVQQGLRTLVVFCLPSAVGLPKGVDLKRDGSLVSSTQSTAAESTSIHRRIPRSEGSIATRSVGVNVSQQRSAIMTRKRSSMSRLSSVDDMSMSIEEEMDPNWGLDRDYLLSVLPEPKEELLLEMSTRYPAQFETLPVQVRSPHCWRLYVKFCFFSGLPIAEGEMHYKVCDEICDTYGEEIILSHEVMEAVNGESAEILSLPNLKTFRYLRRHYNQQSGKLPEDVFLRQSWQKVLPEV